MAKQETANDYHVTVNCPLKGFEDVEVTYNMMATEDQIDAFRTAINEETAAPVIANIAGWDTAQFGDSPWDSSKSPMAFRLWAGRRGWAKAMMNFITDPNF